MPGRAGNSFWLMFADRSPRTAVFEDERAAVVAHHVANLRATHARRPGDEELNALIRDLLEVSAEFRELWERHDVAVLRSASKTVVHPQVGPLQLDCEVLLTASGEQSLVLYTARPGTDAAEKLELLRVLGQETFAAPRATR